MSCGIWTGAWRLLWGGGELVIELPNSALIKLRNSSGIEEKKSEMAIRYVYGDQSITMPVPVMNVQSYTEDEIFDKKLYFLIPFYCIRYENELRELSETDFAGYDRIYLELKEYFDRLITLCELGDISEDDTRKLAELSKVILSYITSELAKDVRERMVSVVGGQVLELQEDRWLKQGIDIGKITARYEDGMDINMIAERTKVSVDIVESVLRNAGMLKD